MVASGGLTRLRSPTYTFTCGRSHIILPPPSPLVPYAECMLVVCICVSANQSVPRDTTSLLFNTGGAECRLRRHTPHSGSLDSHMLASRCTTRSTLSLYHDSPI